MKQVLRYLKGTLKYDIKFSAEEEKPELFCYSNANWAYHHQAVCFRLEVELSAGWSSKKQQTAAKSSTEAQYVALS